MMLPATAADTTVAAAMVEAARLRAAVACDVFCAIIGWALST